MRLCYLNNCDGFVQSNGSNYWVICDIYADGCNIYDIYGDGCDIYGDGYDISCLYRWNVKMFRSICRVHVPWHSAKLGKNYRNFLALSSAKDVVLSKDFFKKYFLCRGPYW